MFPLLAANTSAEGSLWLPRPASSVAERTDTLFHFIYYLSAFFFVAIIATMIVFVVKYRRSKVGDRSSPIAGNHRLELLWSIVPAGFLVVIFAWGFSGYLDLSVPPAGAIDVRVLAQKWSWSFDYPKYGIVGATELVVPEGRPVKLTMSSKDVIHSFYVPAFRIKKDVLPNRYTVAWFEATQAGNYDVRCAEYCGRGHSRMFAQVKVMPSADFEQWAQTGGGPPDGEKLFVARGCVACHSRTSDRMGLPGPPLAAKFGKTEQLADGKSVLIDDNYLRESIVQPNAKIVAGYAPVMPTFAGQLSDPQINALIDYIKSLK